MSLMPGVEHDIVASGRDSNDRMLMTRWDIVCGHTMVGFFPAHAAHFSVRADGYIKQSRDTKNRSAANYMGNHRVIAIENEDHGEPEFDPWNTADGHAVPALTEEQCESNAKIIAWAYREHGIPIESCIDSKPASRGVGYHRMGVDSDNNFAGYAYPGRVAGGELWTIHKGKVCPGDRRIWQYLNVIIPRARVLAGLEEDTVTPEERKILIDELLFRLVPVQGVPNSNAGLWSHWSGANYWAQETYKLLLQTKAELSNDEANIITQVRAMFAAAETGDTFQISDAQIQILASAIVAATPAPVSPERIIAALRTVFLDAGTDPVSGV